MLGEKDGEGFHTLGGVEQINRSLPLGRTPIVLAADAGDYELLFAAPVGDLPDVLAGLPAAVVGDLIDVTDRALTHRIGNERQPADCQ